MVVLSRPSKSMQSTCKSEKVISKFRTHMLRPKRIRQNSTPRPRATKALVIREQPQKIHWIDVWLPRLSHFAQFALFLLTVGGFYFTVLPLYQKALLEEAIAKKEIELATTTKALDQSYSRIRTYAMREFYINAALPCSGLFQRQGDASASSKQTDKKQTRAELIFSINVPTCLQDMTEKTVALKELRSDDRKLFNSAITQLSIEIVERRKASLIQYETAPSRVTDADVNTLPSENYRVIVQEQIEKWKGGKVDYLARRKLAEDITKENIVNEYRKSIIEGIRALEKIKWTTITEHTK